MNKLIVLLMMLATLITFTGCATTQSTQFYLLSSMTTPNMANMANMANEANEANKVEGGAENISLGIGPINIPKYLNRSEIVTRTSSNTLKLSEFHKWAENLDQNIAQVIAENLSLLLGTDRVEIFPWNRQRPIDFQVVIDVLQFDRNQDGTALLLARWSFIDGNDQLMLDGRKSMVQVEPTGQDYESLVKALSETLGGLSREIADAIKSQD